MQFRRCRVLVTGGLGFIGSNLVRRLTAEGAEVTVIDPLVTGCGGKPFNLEGLERQVEVASCSIGDAAIAPLVERAELVFNLAGEISHIHSMLFPERDLEINTLSQLRFLEVCARLNRGVRIVYAGTRQIYGVPEYLPVDEKHPVNPVDFNGVHKYAAAQYHQMLSRMGRIDAVVLRLTNVYGPRMALDIPCQGFFSTYLRKALTGQTLDVFGDGEQVRDPLFVDDAVEAMLTAASTPGLPSRGYNVGGPEALSLNRIAAIVSELAGLAPPRRGEFPADRKAIDIGGYRTDSRKIEAELGWRPRTPFAEGMARTLDYYRECLPSYLDPATPNPPCKLAHSS